MATTLVKLDIHLIFHVKSTSIKLKNDDLSRLFSYVGGIIREHGAIPMAIGGMPDHIHILTTLTKSETIIEFVRIIKVNSSKWIKTINRYYNGFEWQEGYGAFSVSPSLIDKTKKYIIFQSEHHKRHSSLEEYKAFLDAYGIQYDERYILND